jgi:hypothetical protein
MGYDGSTDFKMTSPAGQTIHLKGLTAKADPALQTAEIEKHDTVARRPTVLHGKAKKTHKSSDKSPPQKGGAGSGHKPKQAAPTETKEKPKPQVVPPPPPRQPVAPPALAKGQPDNRPQELYNQGPRKGVENGEFCLTYAVRKSAELHRPMATFGNGLHYAVDLGNDKYLWVSGTPGSTHPDDLLNSVWVSNRAFLEAHFGPMM